MGTEGGYELVTPTYITPDFVQRFWAQVNTSGECWTWQGSRSYGYGIVVTGGRTNRAHRVSFEIAHGPIPKGMLICHTCDNPPCVRPDHLFMGSHADNNQDKARKGRSNKGMHIGGQPEGYPIPLLRAWREQRLLTISELAERAGVSLNTISRIESPRSQQTASLRMVGKIADALGISREELLYEDPRPVTRRSRSA